MQAYATKLPKIGVAVDLVGPFLLGANRIEHVHLQIPLYGSGDLNHHNRSRIATCPVRDIAR